MKIDMKNQVILIIDDDETVRNTLIEVLEKEHYTVFAASNGQEGIEVLEKIPRPCLILLDLMMPIMDGWEFLDFRENDRLISKIPVVVISAFSEQAKKIKVNAFLKKPIDLKRLLETLKKLNC